MSGALLEDEAGWTLGGGERRIDQIQLDYRFGLMLDDVTLITIESPFVVEVDSRSATVVPETLDHVGVALAVLHRTVTSVRAFRTGALLVTLHGGRIEVAPGDRYENWYLLFRDGAQLVGLPGGGVAVFAAACVSTR